MSTIICPKCGNFHIWKPIVPSPAIERQTIKGPVIVSVIKYDCNICQHIWEEEKIIDYGKLECKQSASGRHSWKTQTASDEDRTIPRGDWGLIIGTFCVHCYEIKKENKKKI